MLEWKNESSSPDWAPWCEWEGWMGRGPGRKNSSRLRPHIGFHSNVLLGFCFFLGKRAGFPYHTARELKHLWRWDFKGCNCLILNQYCNWAWILPAYFQAVWIQAVDLTPWAITISHILPHSSCWLWLLETIIHQPLHRSPRYGIFHLPCIEFYRKTLWLLWLP